MNSSADDRDATIRDRLLEFGDTIEPLELIPTLDSRATSLVVRDPFAFVLAVSLDRGKRAEVVWTMPYWIQEQLGHLDARRIADMEMSELTRVVHRLPERPRYVNDAPRTVREIALLVAREFAGDAEAIWRNRSALAVQRTLRRVHGIGPGIASMAVSLLQRCRGVRFPDQGAMNVKPDVHVRRVLYRLGVAPGTSEADALDAAKRLNRDWPGALDSPLWIIGRRWCAEIAPQCADCCMSDLCARRGLPSQR